MAEMSIAMDLSPLEAAQTKSAVTYFTGVTELWDKSPRITIVERPNLLAGQGTTGFRTWSAALHLGSYLATAGRNLVENKRVLELGAGTGFLSILCATIGAGQVVSTDGDPNIVSEIQANVELNEGSHFVKPNSKIKARPLRWGDNIPVEDESASGQQELDYDLVIGADVVGAHLVGTSDCQI